MTRVPAASVSPVPRDRRDRDDWARLVGGIVEVRLNGARIRVGRVGQATADSAMLWIEADAVEQRALFVKASGYRVRPYYGGDR